MSFESCGGWWMRNLTMRRAVDDVARNKLELKEIRCAFIVRKSKLMQLVFGAGAPDGCRRVLAVLCVCGGSSRANVGGLSLGMVVAGTSRRGAPAVGAAGRRLRGAAAKVGGSVAAPSRGCWW